MKETGGLATLYHVVPKASFCGRVRLGDIAHSGVYRSLQQQVWLQNGRQKRLSSLARSQ